MVQEPWALAGAMAFPVAAGGSRGFAVTPHSLPSQEPTAAVQRPGCSSCLHPLPGSWVQLGWKNNAGSRAGARTLK